MIFYLQDASDGNSLGSGKTIATVKVQATSASTPGIGTLKSGSIAAIPNPIRVAAGQTLGVTTLTWQATGVSQVQIRVGSPTGPAMTGIDKATGSAVTGPWVPNGMTFYLQDASSGDSSGAVNTLATTRVLVTSQ